MSENSQLISTTREGAQFFYHPDSDEFEVLYQGQNKRWRPTHPPVFGPDVLDFAIAEQHLDEMLNSDNT